jgi:hypothetical protein
VLVAAASREPGNVCFRQMAAHFLTPGRTRGLIGRRSESDALDRLLEAVRAGEGRAMVVVGEPA